MVHTEGAERITGFSVCDVCNGMEEFGEQNRGLNAKSTSLRIAIPSTCENFNFSQSTLENPVNSELHSTCDFGVFPPGSSLRPEACSACCRASPGHRPSGRPSSGFEQDATLTIGCHGQLFPFPSKYCQGA
jgi:hypothetical protein